jgi:anti-sigma-K factor RskA
VARTRQLPPRVAGTMNPSDGKIPPVIAGDLGNTDQIGITIDPSGGSPQPTSNPIFTVPIT